MYLSHLLGVGPSCEIEVHFNGESDRQKVDVKVDKDKRELLPLYFDGESIAGTISIKMKPNKQLTHNGIKVEFIGLIEMFYDRGNHYEFTSLAQELAAPGELNQTNTSFNFEFKNVEKPYESYHGINVKLRYFVRAIISRRISDVVKESDIWVHSYSLPTEINNTIKMEVGIEDCLHIEFEYSKSLYHLKDVIVGKIYFLLVRIKIKHMELSIIRRETTGSAPNQYNESETITKFEIMDGAPVRGETIPIRLFMGGFELTPTYHDINKKFSTRYYLNLVLIDEESRRYFKQQEITVYRKRDNEPDIDQNQLLLQNGNSNGNSIMVPISKNNTKKIINEIDDDDEKLVKSDDPLLSSQQNNDDGDSISKGTEDMTLNNEDDDALPDL